MFAFIMRSVKKLVKEPAIKLLSALFRRKKPLRAALSAKVALSAAKSFARGLPNTLIQLSLGLFFDLAFLAFEIFLLKKLRASTAH